MISLQKCDRGFAGSGFNRRRSQPNQLQSRNKERVGKNQRHQAKWFVLNTRFQAFCVLFGDNTASLILSSKNEEPFLAFVLVLIFSRLYLYADEYVDEEGVRWVAQRPRPNISLMNHYQCTWKPRNNHFLRYQDVKPKGKTCVSQQKSSTHSQTPSRCCTCAFSLQRRDGQQSMSCPTKKEYLPKRVAGKCFIWQLNLKKW